MGLDLINLLEETSQRLATATGVEVRWLRELKHKILTNPEDLSFIRTYSDLKLIEDEYRRRLTSQPTAQLSSHVRDIINRSDMPMRILDVIAQSRGTIVNSQRSQVKLILFRLHHNGSIQRVRHGVYAKAETLKGRNMELDLNGLLEETLRKLEMARAEVDRLEKLEDMIRSKSEDLLLFFRAYSDLDLINRENRRRLASAINGRRRSGSVRSRVRDIINQSDTPMRSLDIIERSMGEIAENQHAQVQQALSSLYHKGSIQRLETGLYTKVSNVDTNVPAGGPI